MTASLHQMCVALSQSSLPSKQPPLTLTVLDVLGTCINLEPQFVQNKQSIVPPEPFERVYTEIAPGDGSGILKAGNIAVKPKSEED